MLLSKATYNWGIYKAIHLEEANFNFEVFFMMKSSSVERDEFSVVA